MDNTNDVEKEFFTVKDIQIYLGIGQNTAYALLKKTANSLYRWL